VSAGPWFPVDEEDNEDCLAALDAVELYFTEHREEIEAATSADELAWAWIALEGLRAAHGLAWGLTVSDIPFGYDSRDLGMAEVLLRLHALLSPGAKTVIWAHDWHIARRTPAIVTDAEWGQAGSMGTHLAAALGADYAPFALAAHTVRFHWPWLEEDPVEHVADGGLEEHLHRFLRPVLLVDAAAPGLCPPGVTCRRTWPDFATTTDDWAYWQAFFDQAEQFRGVVFLDVSHEMEPLREYGR
jgi:erythromycin esterase-like protein